MKRLDLVIAIFEGPPPHARRIEMKDSIVSKRYENMLAAMLRSMFYMATAVLLSTKTARSGSYLNTESLTSYTCTRYQVFPNLSCTLEPHVTSILERIVNWYCTTSILLWLRMKGRNWRKMTSWITNPRLGQFILNLQEVSRNFVSLTSRNC